MWDVILKSLRGSCIVLTTHSLEETEALCTRLAILVKGRMVCVGTPQHLKSRYGLSYQLDIKLTSPDKEEVLLDELRRRVQGVHVEESWFGRLTCILPVEGNPSIGDLFEVVEGLKDNAGVEEYILSQTTLEQVYLKFAREQTVEELRAAGSLR